MNEPLNDRLWWDAMRPEQRAELARWRFELQMRQLSEGFATAFRAIGESLARIVWPS